MRNEVILAGANFLLLVSCLQPTSLETNQMGPSYKALPTFTPTATPEPTPSPRPTIEPNPTPTLFDEALRPLFDLTKNIYFGSFNRIPDFYPASVSPITLLNEDSEHPFDKMLQTLEPQDIIDPPKNFFNWPTYGPIWTYFGRGHFGIDIERPYGSPIYSAAGGIVVFQEKLAYSYGYNIWVNHGNRFLSHYSHLSEFSVKVGDDVIQSQVIGKVGVTGKATGPHLDFQIVARTDKGWYYIDPLLFLP